MSVGDEGTAAIVEGCEEGFGEWGAAFELGHHDVGRFSRTRCGEGFGEVFHEVAVLLLSALVSLGLKRAKIVASLLRIIS